MAAYQWLDQHLLAQPATEKIFHSPWQAHKYLVRDKMYAYIGVNDQNGRPIITLKLKPIDNDLLRQQYTDIVPGYYLNKAHWSTVYLDGTVPKEVVASMVNAAHKTILASLSKKAQREILATN